MSRRTTVILTSAEEQALRAASRAQGVSQSELIRRGVRLVTAAQGRRPRPTVGWLKLSTVERRQIAADEFGDIDA